MSDFSDEFARRQNIENFNRRLREATDGAQRKTLMTLLAEEIAKPVVSNDTDRCDRT
ncbi:MAG: hypothetical protein ACHP84_20085 [Caulobacterales bacterium]